MPNSLSSASELYRTKHCFVAKQKVQSIFFLDCRSKTMKSRFGDETIVDSSSAHDFKCLWIGRTQAWNMLFVCKVVQKKMRDLKLNGSGVIPLRAKKTF